TTADLHDLCSGTDVGSGLMTLWPDRAGVVAGQASRVGAVEDRKARGRIEPAFRPKRELRINGEPRYQRVAVALGNTAQRVQGWPRAFWIHVVGRDRRNAAPIVDAGVEQPAQRGLVGEIRRSLDVHVE